MSNIYSQFPKEPKSPDNEVARLRELLDECASFMALHSRVGAARSTASEMRNRIIAALGTAPEKPVTKRVCKDCGQPHSKHTLHPYETICPKLEWRIKEKGEIIEADDQYNSPMAGWVPALSLWVGEKIQTSGRIRTRRPLPTTNRKKNSSKLVVEPKQEMPLDIFEYHLVLCENAGENDDLLHCLRYLRDEIQKLKEGK